MLLPAKLHPPRLRARLVSRPRLTRRLTVALRQGTPLVVVSAPAGFGKTTFISEWHATRAGRQFPLAWLALDKRDNDPARFWAYLVRALEGLFPRLAQQAPPDLEAGDLAGQFEELAAMLGEQPALARPALLVLDDYHLITNAALHAALAQWLERLPPSLRLALLCRAEPPLPLARWRASGQVAAFDVADLRFSQPEAGRFLNGTMGLRCAPARVAALTAQTEGWAAGLQLLALAAQSRPEMAAPGALQPPGLVFDYLAQEVFAQQPPAVQSFLLHTAVLERLTPALCEALYFPEPVLAGGPLPSGGGRAGLERLVRAQLFVTELDEEGAWFRYHPLMAEFLRARLAEAPRAQAQALHQRASDWLAAAGDQPAAVEHALAAEDFQRAAALLPDAIDELLRSGHNQTVLDWFQRVPEPLKYSSTRLIGLWAWALMLTGRLEEAETYIAEAETAGTHLGHMALLRCEVARQRGQLSQMTILARQALAQLPEQSASLRTLAAVDLGYACYQTGQWHAALAALDEAERWASLAEHPAIYSRLVVLLAPLRVAQGRPDEAERLLADGMAQLQGRARLRLFQRFVHRLLAQIALERNDLAAAGEQAEACRRLTAPADAALLREALLLSAQVKLAAGEMSAAQALLAQASAALPASLERGARGRLAAREARLWLRLGDLPAAERAFRPGLRPEADQPPFQVPQETFMLARLYLARGQCPSALTVLRPALAAAEADGRRAHVAEAQALCALAWQAGGEPAAAVEALGAALAAAEPAGRVRLFLDEGPPMRMLLQALAARGPAQPGAQQAAQLLELWALKPIRLPVAPSLALPVALTPSELAVLRCMAAGQSHAQIAGELTVSLNTVRSHAKHLYGKLDVHSRTQAIARARELGLL
jgi:LuxR family maltose regulon positive regulatory protein